MEWYARGAEQDYEKAVEWYEKSAEAENSMGMYYLGIAFENGEGVEPDMEKAIEWYKMAAEAGNEEAAARLTELGQ